MTHLALLLHGVGAQGADMGGLAEALALPGLAFAAPDAPFPFNAAPGSPGRQWFSVSGVTAANRAARVADARAPFDRVIADTLAAHGLTGRPDRVVLIGFSQGAIMALDAIATGRIPAGGLIAFSGRLATPAPLAPARTPILIAHGRQDGVIPVTEATAAATALTAAGNTPDLILEDGLGHAPGPAGLARARALLTRWMAASA